MASSPRAPSTHGHDSQQRRAFLNLNPIDRHNTLARQLRKTYHHHPNNNNNNLLHHHQGGVSMLKTDFDILKENYRFIRSAKDDADDSWESRLAKRYFARLYREYAIADLSRYKLGQIGLRWRTEKEVIQGLGQFSCGAKGCAERQRLSSYEVPFVYKENGEVKRALVKVRVCTHHAEQLNYKKSEKKEKKKEKKRKRKEDHSEESLGDSTGHEVRKTKIRALGEEEGKHERMMETLDDDGGGDDMDDGDNDGFENFLSELLD